MSEATILEYGSLDLSKQASAQLRDYFEDIESKKIDDLLDIPSKIQRNLENSRGLIVLVDTTEEAFVNEVVGKVLQVELNSGKPVQKLFLEKANESKENFQKRAQEKTREHAEKLANKIKNSRENSRHEQI